VSKNLETSTPVSPEEIVWRTESSVCNSGPTCQCLFCEVLRTRESPRDALQRLAREYVAAYLNKWAAIS
jgi:hypothetical protein